MPQRQKTDGRNLGAVTDDELSNFGNEADKRAKKASASKNLVDVVKNQAKRHASIQLLGTTDIYNWKDQAAKKNDARDKKNPLAQAKGK